MIPPAVRDHRESKGPGSDLVSEKHQAVTDETQIPIQEAEMIQAWRSRFQPTLWRKSVLHRDPHRVLINTSDFRNASL